LGLSIGKNTKSRQVDSTKLCNVKMVRFSNLAPGFY